MPGRGRLGPRDRDLAFLLAEYENVNKAIEHRIDLQYRNANMFAILFTPASVFIVTLVADKGVDGFAHNHLVFLLPLMSILGTGFIVRNIDHDAHRIDLREYLEREIRPKVNSLMVTQIPDWETFFTRAVWARKKRYAAISYFGGELTIVVVVTFVYLVASVYLLFDYRELYLSSLYFWLTALAAALFAWCIVGFSRVLTKGFMAVKHGEK
jgi:hypothetical protein